MKLLKIYILIYFFSFSSSRDYSTKPPKNLKHIKNIYSSWSNIESFNRPIITWDYIYYIQRGVLSAFNYNDIIFTPNVFYPYGDNYYLKPIDSYSSTFNDYVMFFTKDCSLRIYNIYDKQFNYNNAILNIRFNDLNSGKCYDSLRIYYGAHSSFIAVYNLNYNKIIVLEILSIYSSSDDEKYRRYMEVKMEGRITKALIFTKYDKALLIGYDSLGNINFWNIKNYCEGIWNNIKVAYNDNLIKSFKFGYSSKEDFATIIDFNKLLIINDYDFLVFDLNTIETIHHFITFDYEVSCLLGLKDGRVLLGTTKGILYLIEYNGLTILELDKKLLCPNKYIYSLSSISNCTPGTTTCYIIAANCGYLKIFEIQSPSNGSSDL